MKQHLRQAWAAAVTAKQGSRFVHVPLPDDPHEAYQLLVSLAPHTGRRHAAAHEEGHGYDQARIADLIAEDGGGFSYHPGKGPAPSSGFMASYEAPEGSGIGAVHHISQLQPEHIAAHREAIKEHLAKPDSYQGGWYDKGDGHVYLDASRHFHDEGSVRQFALDEKQKAYFDLGKFEETYLHPKLDPKAMTDHSGWEKHYKEHGHEPPAQYHSYAHLYPPTDEQKDFWANKGHKIGQAKPPHLAGRPLGPWME